MATVLKSLPKWILIVSGIFSLLEIMVSLLLCFSPQSVAENVDLTAKGVNYLIYMWAARQFALGFILGFATIKRSIPMLTISYVFLLVMFIGDFIIGVIQNENSLIIAALVMCIISSAMLFAIISEIIFTEIVFIWRLMYNLFQIMKHSRKLIVQNLTS
jgi:hypothetical protein